MTMPPFITNIGKLLKSNSPEIFTALGVTGVVTTAYLAARASFKARDIIEANESETGVNTNRKEQISERTKLVWKLYIPAASSGMVTVGCIIGASKANGRRTAAAVTAYSLGERAFSEYREKVAEQIGKGREQKIRDDIVQDHISKRPPSREVVVIGSGHVLCCELTTMRYFRSDMETLRKAQNDINAKIVRELYVTLNEFYDIFGLAHTSNSDIFGWNSDKLLELQFSTVLSEGGEPCLAFEYNYLKPL